MKKAELVFIPSPGLGHLVSTVEIAKLLFQRDERLSITVLVMKLPNFDTKISTVTQSLSTTRLRFVDLPLPPESTSKLISRTTFDSAFIESHKTHVRDVVAEMARSGSTQIAGFVIDMFCTTMIDVANEFGFPTYVFFTSGAGTLGLMFHLQTLLDDHHNGVTDYKDSNQELSVPSFANPVPAKVLPSVVLDKEGGSTMFLSLARRFREAKGIIINTFSELESHALNSLSDGNTPPVYPVGPILNLSSESDQNPESGTILQWLDNHASSSVVFLCFGSMGGFYEDQVKEIAYALEWSDHQFLWSLRRPPPMNKVEFPCEYSYLDEVLPDGFLERTAEKGRVIGWAPQVAVLSHPAVGGFVSHCGWNSTLESVWCGVPVATWPLYAEQQLNAFEMVVELGLAAEIKMDYRKDFRITRTTDPVPLVTAEEIENGIKRLMMENNEIRKKVKEMSEKSRMAMGVGGSSYASLQILIEDVKKNIP